MLFQFSGILLLASCRVLAQSQSVSGLSVSDSRTTETGTTLSITEASIPTGSYLSYSTQITQGTAYVVITGPSLTTTIGAGNFTTSANQSSITTTETRTYLTGSVLPTTTTFAGNFSVPANASRSSTTISPTPTVVNTRPCNNYPEFCARKYSNITEVACHNSPFVTQNNLAANQQYDVTSQLNDGVRFIQAQIQWPTNGTVPHFCHTSCDILDAGPITDWLSQVTQWVAKHPYDVVTILLGNGNYSQPSMYVPYIEQTGILNYVYTPPYAPMKLNDWPTLTEMIITGKRVVMFLDYSANQTQYPWLLDEFSQMWETPFDPTNQSFPCDIQRPPDLAVADAQDRLYLMNHNLNVEISLFGASILVPARTELAITNNVTGFGSVGLAAQDCKARYNRAPNFLNVDYYNLGGYAGSVFEAAAQFNNVTYNRACCGITTSSASLLVGPSLLTLSLGLMFVFLV